MPEGIPNAAIGAFLPPINPVLEHLPDDNQEVEAPTERIDYVKDENDPDDFLAATRFRASDKGTQFEKQYKEELTQLSKLITSDFLAPNRVLVLQQNVEDFKRNLFDSADFFTSKTWMMFQHARDDVSAIMILLSSPKIEKLEKTIALERATGEINLCADGVVSNLKTARLRLECVEQGGAAAVLGCLAFQQIEAEAKSFAQQVFGGMENYEGNETHIANAFKDYAILTLFKGLEAFRSEDDLAPYYIHGTADHDLENFSSRLSASTTPGSVMTRWAAQYQAVLESVIANHFPEGNIQDTGIIERGFTVEQLKGELHKDLQEKVVEPLQLLLSSTEESHFMIIDVMDDEEIFSWDSKDVMSFTKSEQKIAVLLSNAAEPFLKSLWPDTLALPEKITELRATESSLHHKNGVEFWVKCEGSDATRAPRIADLTQLDLHTLLPSLAVDLTRRALSEETTPDELINFVSTQLSNSHQDPNSPFRLKNPAIELSVMQAVQDKASTDAELRTGLTEKIMSSETIETLAVVQPLVGMSSVLKAAYVDRIYQLVPVRSGTLPETLGYLKDLDVVSLLSENSLNTISQELYTLANVLVKAAGVGHIGAVRNILKANDEAVDAHRPIIAYGACRNGHVEIVKLLLDKETDVHRQDGQGSLKHTTLLHAATKSGSAAVMELLLSKGGNIGASDGDGALPLHIACQRNKLEIAALLLDKKVHIDRWMVGPEGNTPLTYACEHGRSELVTLLLAKGVNVHQTRMDGHSPLAMACRKVDLDTVTQLLDKGADINLQISDREGNTPLTFACQHDLSELVTLLLAKGANVHRTRMDGYSPLAMACRKVDLDTVTQLLDKGADIDAFMADGNTPLAYACDRNYSQLIELLLVRGANLNLSKDNQLKPLEIVCLQGNMQLVNMLLSEGAAVNPTKPFGTSPLICASAAGNTEVAKLLIENGADINAWDSDGDTPLIVACNEFKYEAVNLLLGSGADINQANSEGNTAFISAYRSEDIQLVQLLINNKADINKRDPDGNTPLISACSYGNVTLVQLLLNSGADINKKHSNGNTPLISACTADSVATVAILLDIGADINETGAKNWTPLTRACNDEKCAVAKLLINRGADVNKTGMNNNTPLVLAQEASDPELVKMILNKLRNG